MRVKLDPASNVYSAEIQASHVLSSLAAPNGLVEVMANITPVAGAAVRVLGSD